ncbi:hypothetical protein AB205_0163970 [Aquarana catesbeiana]|uniref:Uncharacterized protein n=1 Tax=Aquarana catesbeiana TaxID=8400 RepID=A0A2G9RGW4_AQUCT|nr:hypothetical protein AB205_0163970 [Aquarana catesbeiana]
MLQISVGIPRMSGAHRRFRRDFLDLQMWSPVHHGAVHSGVETAYYVKVSFLVMIKLVLIKMQLWYQDMRTKLGVQIYLIQVWMKLHSQQRC